MRHRREKTASECKRIPRMPRSSAQGSLQFMGEETSCVGEAGLRSEACPLRKSTIMFIQSIVRSLKNRSQINANLKHFVFSLY